MRSLLFCFIGVCLALQASAQKDLLQLDEANKYVYYQVVEKPATGADTLFARATGFAAKAKLITNVNAADHTLRSNGKFMGYTGSSVMRKEAGEVSYGLFIETKDNKYRYKLSNMVFNPYVRNRYGNMEAVVGLTIPLEDLSSRYTKKEREALLTQVGTFGKNFGDRLKIAMDAVAASPKNDAVKKVATDKW